MEIGGLGFGQEQEAAWLEENVLATRAIMRELGMVEGEARRPSRFLLIDDYWRVGPRAAGYLEVAVGLDRQFGEIAKGEILGRVIDPATFEVVDELRSPGRGVLFYACRSHVVRPGSWAFGVANLEEGKCQWVSG
jgi:predicted deacylase